MFAGLILRETLEFEEAHQLFGHANAGGSSPEEENPMVLEWVTRSGRRKFCRVDKPGQNDGPSTLLSHRKPNHQTHGIGTGLGEVRTLNIIIESGIFIPIEIQVFERVVCGEVLEKHIRPHGESHG